MPDYTIRTYLHTGGNPAGEPLKLTIHDDDSQLDWFGQDEDAPETITIDDKELTVRGSGVFRFGFTTADGQQVNEDMVVSYVDELGWLLTPAEGSAFGEGAVITEYLGWQDYGIPHDKFADFAAADFIKDDEITDEKDENDEEERDEEEGEKEEEEKEDDENDDKEEEEKDEDKDEGHEDEGHEDDDHEGDEDDHEGDEDGDHEDEDDGHEDDHEGDDCDDDDGDDDDDYVCFVTGTLIDTPEGPRRVETLRPGDIVLTANAGPQPILWTGASPIPRNDPRARPIEIPPQALGPGMPAHPIRLSPRHRVRVPGWLAQLAAGCADALAPVSALVGHRGIRPVPAGATQRYHHLLLPLHGALICSGLPCESLYPGAVALRAMSRPARRSLQAAFPRLAADPDSYGPTAYPCLTPHEVRAFLRHPSVASRAHGTPPQTLPDPARSPHQRLAGG